MAYNNYHKTIVSSVTVFRYQTLKTVQYAINLFVHIFNWGEPERAPHKREVRAVGLSVCTFMTQKYTRTVLIYGYLQLLIAAFKAG